MGTKICPVCKELFNGRTDKVYCSVRCKNKVHNHYSENYYAIAKQLRSELEQKKKLINDMEKTIVQLTSENKRLKEAKPVNAENKLIGMEMIK
jgi:hypothetical protein